MLKRVTLENFFSFGRKTEIELHPNVNVLVGINGSGKSNFLKAIQLLYEGISGKGLEKLLLQEWGGFDTVAFNKFLSNKIQLSFEFDRNVFQRNEKSYESDNLSCPVYEINIHKAGDLNYYLHERVYDSVTKEEFLNIKNAEGFLKDGAENQGNEEFTMPKNSNLKTFELVLRQLYDQFSYFSISSFREIVSELRVYRQFDLSENSPPRKLQSYSTEKVLNANGDNLCTILQNIENNHISDFESLMREIEQINPMFKRIGFARLGADSQITLIEKHLNKSIRAQHISDGTLRYILLLSILFNPDQNFLVALDEPEQGLHPDMMNSIAEFVRNSQKENVQYLFATHSPLFLNRFEIEEILIFEKDKDNQTQVKVKSEEDFEDWNDDYLAGQLWLRGALGGKRW
ncbi:MAG: AAA family ATPase [Okeania sp. SIO3C4]|nr:AAA family ATPase [Okeania sp. SIO3C4]